VNENIRKLVSQAFTGCQGEKFDPEKFAQLIVAECIQICDETRKLVPMVTFKDDEQITAVVCMIKKHFGVKE